MIDILKFTFLYLLVLFSFSCGKNSHVVPQLCLVVDFYFYFCLSLTVDNFAGMNQLLWYYADLEKKACQVCFFSIWGHP